MAKKQDLRQILKQVRYRASNPTQGDTRFQIACVIYGVVLFFSALILIVIMLETDNVLFLWVLYTLMAGAVVLLFASLAWRVWDIVKQMEANEQGTKTPS